LAKNTVFAGWYVSPKALRQLVGPEFLDGVDEQDVAAVQLLDRVGLCTLLLQRGVVAGLRLTAAGVEGVDAEVTADHGEQQGDDDAGQSTTADGQPAEPTAAPAGAALIIDLAGVDPGVLVEFHLVLTRPRGTCSADTR
jgi:hypothetical protein